VHEGSLARKNVEYGPPLVFHFGQRDLIGVDVDDFAILPEDHGNAGAAMIEDSFAEGTIYCGLWGLELSKDPQRMAIGR